MANFEPALKRVLAYEGGYSNDPADAGGETYRGIARNHFPKWPGWPSVDAARGEKKLNTPNVTAALLPLVSDFYREHFWNPIRGDALDQRIGEELFDIAVNMGVGFATKTVQNALNILNRNGASWAELKVDGAFGPKTLSTIVNATKGGDNVQIFCNLINLLQGEHYLNIVRANPSQEVFIRGWLNRVEITHG